MGDDEWEEVEEVELTDEAITSRSLRSRRNNRRRPLIRPDGLVNGRSLINGEGLINGRGLVNGKGLINGRSLTNGRRFHYGERKPERKGSAKRYVAAAAVALILAAAFVPIIYYYYQPTGIAIDGFFTDWDWKKVKRYYEEYDPNPVGNDDINLYQFAFKVDGDNLYLYANVNGELMKGSDNGVDSFYVFLDTDSKVSTGYLYTSREARMGVDYMVHVYGWDGKVRSAGLYRYGGTGQSQWVWELVSNVRAACAGSEMELEVWTAPIPTSVSSWAVSYHTEDRYGHYDDTGAFSLTKRFLFIYQATRDVKVAGGNTYMLTVTARAPRYDPIKHVDVDNVTISSMNFGWWGGSGSITLYAPDGSIVPPGSISWEVSKAPQVFKVYVSSGSSLVGVYLSSVASTGFAYPGAAEKRVAYTSVPSGIVIDGAFADWDGVPGQNDPSGDLSTADYTLRDAHHPPPESEVVYNGNIDIRGYAATVSNGRLNFYMRVDKEMLGGFKTLSERLRTSGGPGGGAGGRKEVPTGEDAAYIFIDSDGNADTGYSPDFSEGRFPVGADYMVKVTGKNGQILKRTLYSHSGSRGEWRWNSIGSVSAEVDFSRMEVGVDLSTIGMSSSSPYAVYFYTTDWTGQTDRSNTVTSGGSRSYSALTVDVDGIAPNTAHAGSEDVGVLKLVMTGERWHISGIHVDVLGDARVTGVSMYLDDGDGYFMPDADLLLSAAAPGEAVVCDLEGGRHVVYLSVDLAEDAEPDTGFGLRVVDVVADVDAVLNVHPSAEMLSHISRGGGSRYTSLNGVYINEVKIFSSNSTVQWIEIINSKGSSVNIGGWCLYNMSNIFSPKKIYCFSSGTTMSDNTTRVISYTSFVNAVTKSDPIFLVDGSGSTKDSVTPSSACSGLSNGNSCARYRDSNYDPTDVWYEDSTPSYNAANDEIPEFRDVVVPVAAVLVGALVLGRRRRKNLSKDVP